MVAPAEVASETRESEKEPVAEAIPEPESDSEILPDPVKKQKSGKALKAVLIALASLVALLVIYVVVMRLFPDLFNSLLYTPEELEIINFK